MMDLSTCKSRKIITKWRRTSLRTKVGRHGIEVDHKVQQLLKNQSYFQKLESALWKFYDASALVSGGASFASNAKLFVDQGSGGVHARWVLGDLQAARPGGSDQPEGGGYRLEWYNRTGQDQHVVTIASGSPLSARFLLDMNGAPPIFQKGYLAQLTCVAGVAK